MQNFRLRLKIILVFKKKKKTRSSASAERFSRFFFLNRTDHLKKGKNVGRRKDDNGIGAWATIINKTRRGTRVASINTASINIERETCRGSEESGVCVRGRKRNGRCGDKNGD